MELLLMTGTVNKLAVLVAIIQSAVLLMIFSNTLDSFILIVHSFTKQYPVWVDTDIGKSFISSFDHSSVSLPYSPLTEMKHKQ